MPFEIWNRRYTGSKYKIADWIAELITINCKGDSFCDIFAGTAIISEKMLPYMKEIRINDFLYSNQVIYKAFFGYNYFDTAKIAAIKEDYNNLDTTKLNDNYVSKNFGNKFFSQNDAKQIGYIRENIRQLKMQLNEKEEAILIASLLYSADKAANTVGHYDAFIKGHDIPDRFKFDLVSPYNTSNNEIFITREDANQLARKINCDIVYIDPPYNSRQYSRFYHVLDNVACWKNPPLFGVALKPEPDNMSDYCRNTATKVFSDLIETLSCKYIVVSYNNTYESKSSSSRNKISLENIKEILEHKGRLEIFEKHHQFFNAGKTDFPDHKEFIFIVEVGN